MSWLLNLGGRGKEDISMRHVLAATFRRRKADRYRRHVLEALAMWKRELMFIIVQKTAHLSWTRHGGVCNVEG